MDMEGKKTIRNIPVHVSIIMDGNGRWAKERGMERIYGHQHGAESVRECCKLALEYGVRYLSLFAFSEENWGRPKEEVDALMDLMLSSLVNERKLFLENDIRFRVVGEKKGISAEILGRIDDLERETAAFDRLTLVIFFNYSGKWDIMQAAEKYALERASCPGGGPADVPDREMFAGFLATSGIPDPDLLIRTSGEKRLSNFMLWQCAYTEFYFTDVFWPDFREKEWASALESYSDRERRYGKIK